MERWEDLQCCRQLARHWGRRLDGCKSRKTNPHKKHVGASRLVERPQKLTDGKEAV